jgi:hypothetical protein
LSRPGEAVTMAGAATIAMKAMARISSWNISVLLCKQRNSFTSSGLRNLAQDRTWRGDHGCTLTAKPARPLLKRIIGWIWDGENSTRGTWNAAQVVG